MADPPIFLSLAIPVYNEEAVLPALFTELDRLKQAQWKGFGGVEILLVNDGSRDRSWDLISRKCEADADYIGINLSRNFGHQYALTAGLEAARGEVVVSMDADLQDPPALIAEMIALHRKGYDIVHASRRARGRESFLKGLTAGGFYYLIGKLSKVRVPRNTGDFRLISRRALASLKGLQETHRFLRGLVPWIGYPQTRIFYDRNDRAAGKTHYPFSRMLLLAFDGIASMSTLPLRAAYLASIGLFLIFLGYVIVACYRYFFLDIPLVPGWTSLMSAITIFGTIQLILLGILGEYVGRIYEQTKRRPLYIIQEIKRRK